jgi:hypothetical protein
MTHPPGLSQWIKTVSTHMPHLSKPQATVLAMYSFGVVIAQSCGLTSVVAVLAILCQQSEHTVRQRLREFYYDKGEKRGANRQEVVVESCFAPLLRWVLAWWDPNERRLALALDATTLRDAFTVLSLHVVYCGCAIPIAWVVVNATRKGSWKPHWERLLNRVRDVVPPDWFVLVLTDRGLYARWLYRKIDRMTWHPAMRINDHHQVRPRGTTRWRPILDLVERGGPVWCGHVTCFTTAEAQLDCTLLVQWDADAAEPWVIVTDLAPAAAESAWYGMRSWIEASYKDMKRGGWHWEQTKMDDPARVARLWLVLAVATLWVVSVGGKADPTLPASSLPATLITAPEPSAPRQLSCFRRGVLRILCALILQQPLPLGHFAPEAWPETATAPPAAPRDPPAESATALLVGVVLLLLYIQLCEGRHAGAENP